MIVVVIKATKRKKNVYLIRRQTILILIDFHELKIVCRRVPLFNYPGYGILQNWLYFLWYSKFRFPYKNLMGDIVSAAVVTSEGFYIHLCYLKNYTYIFKTNQWNYLYFYNFVNISNFYVKKKRIHNIWVKMWILKKHLSI